MTAHFFAAARAQLGRLRGTQDSTPMDVDPVSSATGDEMAVDRPNQAESNQFVPVQLLSDIHLEFTFKNLASNPALPASAQGYRMYTFPARAPNLALCGDIGSVADSDNGFFDWLISQLKQFERVFFVMGNHEFYRSTYEGARKKMHEFSKSVQSMRARTADKKIGEFILLDRTRYDLSPSVTVLGCTLWSNVPPQAEAIVALSLTDMKQIRQWDVDAHNAAHRREVAWLADAIARIRRSEPHRRVVVMTHHAPTAPGTSEPRHETETNLVRHAFVTQLEGTPCWGSPVTAWAFGHTHYSCDFVRDGVRVVSNQRGYENVRYRGAFDEDKVLLV